MTIYAVRATAGQERVVAEIMYREALNKTAENEEQGRFISSVLYTTGLKGYVLVEADSPGTVDDLARNVPKTKGLLLKKKGDLKSAGIIPINELEETLEPTPVISEASKGDLIELISGPFKGEKARIARIDEAKNSITVELIEAAVPIPVIVRGDDIRIIKQESATDEEEDEDK